MTTEMLAQAYDVTPKQIRQNYANNRERFTEGKHFFSISGQDLKGFSFASRKFSTHKSHPRFCADTLTNSGAARQRKD